MVTSTYWELIVLNIVRDRKFKTHALHSVGVQFNCGAEKAEKEICVYTHSLSHVCILTHLLIYTQPPQYSQDSNKVGFKKRLQQGRGGGWLGEGIYFHSQSMWKK